MNDTLPGIERIKTRFLSLLAERQTAIARHALAAWESGDATERLTHLTEAQNLLHQIAGSAGSLGFAPLGQTASECEHEIIACIADNAHQTQLDEALISKLDMFVSKTQALLSQHV